jgi:uncharacterized cupredoxin-like copper-binding protein
MVLSDAEEAASHALVMLLNKMGAKATVTQTSVVSSDGKTRTLTTTGTNPQGQTVNNVTVYDKQ